MIENTGVSEDVVVAATQFMRALTNEYGVERAHGFFSELAPAMGEDVHAAVFMYMLTGTYSDTVRFRAPAVGWSYANGGVGLGTKVEAIKRIRNATGLGLKESKDIVDAADHGEAVVQVNDYKYAKELASALRNLGCRVV